MALPPVAAPALPLEEPHLDPLAFPDTLPKSVLPDVPFPKEDYPEWTTTPYNDVGVPQTFDQLIELPEDPQEHPALYAAAIDTMRATNDYFWKQEGIDGNSLSLDQVEQKQQQMPTFRDADGHECYPRPPDPRTLFVKAAIEDDPLNDAANSLWIEACDEVRGMSVVEWANELKWSRDDTIHDERTGDERTGDERTDEQRTRRYLFIRYVAWNEFVAGISARSRTIHGDVQPTFGQLDNFFHTIGMPEDGVTLVDICHEFPRARDTLMLVYRIERFANLREYPDERSVTGGMEPVENKYIRKPNPTDEELNHIPANLQQEGFVTIFGLANQYYPSVGNVERITTALEALEQMALPDSTGRRFFTTEAIALGDSGDDDYINGITIEELRERFTNRGWGLDWFRVWLEEYMYFDEEEGRHFPRSLREDTNDLETREESILERNRLRVDITWNPATIHIDHRWDRHRLGYVQREPPVVEDPADTAEGAHAAGEGDGTATPTNSDGSGRPPTPEAGPSARTRGAAKRAAAGSARPARATKRARTGDRVQCSGRTRLEEQCRRTKSGDPDEEWDCGVHGRRH